MMVCKCVEFGSRFSATFPNIKMEDVICGPIMPPDMKQPNIRTKLAMTVCILLIIEMRFGVNVSL